MTEQKLTRSSHYNIIRGLNKLQDLTQRILSIQMKFPTSFRDSDFAYKNALIFKMIAKKLYDIDLEIRPVGVASKYEKGNPSSGVEYYHYCVNVANTPFGEVRFDPTRDPRFIDDEICNFYSNAEQYKKSNFFKSEKVDVEELTFLEEQIQNATNIVKKYEDSIKISNKSNLMQLHRYIDKFIYNSSPAFNKESNYFTDYETQRLLEIHNLVCYEK